MLQIGSPKAALLKEKLDGLEWEGIHFQVVQMQGLTMTVKHDGCSDAGAKAAVKRYIASLPEYGKAYTNIQYVDENGRIL